MALAEPKTGDTLVEQQGARVYLTARVATLLDGGELDWRPAEGDDGFTVHHPSLSSCG